MSIFAEFGGRSSYYTANEIDRLENPEKYDYDQAGYDAFAAAAAKKADARQAALEASQDAIPYSYVGRGTGATNPAFSFAGYSGHTSGGTSGLSGFGGLAGLFGGGSTTETQGSSEGGGGGGGGGGGPPDDDRGNVQHRAEGGVIYSTMPVGNMKAELPFKPELITKQMPPIISDPMPFAPQVMPAPTSVTGVPDTPAVPKPIGTPFADPIKPTMQAMPVARSGPIISGPMPPPPDMGTGVVGPVAPSPGIGGAFEAQFNGGGPLSAYQRYLMETYAAPALNTADQMVREDVNYFVDLVNQAEQAHFGQSMAQPSQQGIGSLPMAY